jgi:hypothetical protein
MQSNLNYQASVARSAELLREARRARLAAAAEANGVDPDELRRISSTGVSRRLAHLARGLRPALRGT